MSPSRDGLDPNHQPHMTLKFLWSAVNFVAVCRHHVNSFYDFHELLLSAVVAASVSGLKGQ